MPVNTRTPAFEHMMNLWKRCRDVMGGADTVKDASEAYLPRLSGQGIIQVTSPGLGTWAVDEYLTYKTRANFYPATARTRQGILGALFRKPPKFQVPPVMDPALANITHAGEDLMAFAQRLALDVLTTGLVGVYIDVAIASVVPQPYWVFYPAEQVMGTRIDVINGDQVLTRVVLEETVTIPSAEDEFAEETYTRWRVLELDERGLFHVRLFDQPRGASHPEELGELHIRGDSGTMITVDLPLTPMIRGQRLGYIPFVFFGASSLMPVPEKPPLLDLVDVNLSHYRTSADLEEGRHKLSIPTFFAAGFPPYDDQGNRTVLALGANIAHITDNPQAKAWMLEFTGSGLSELRLAMQEKQDMMASIGARLLEMPKAGIESAAAIQLRTAGEQNFLMMLARTLSQGLQQALRYHAEWMGLNTSSMTAEINHDFVETRLSPDDRKQLMAELQGGLISRTVYWYNMERGEIYPPQRTMDEEFGEIDAAESPLAGEMRFERADGEGR